MATSSKNISSKFNNDKIQELISEKAPINKAACLDISILIPTYKRQEILTETLISLCSLNINRFSWEVIVVDNAGCEETRKIVDSFKDKLVINFLVEKKNGKNNALNLAIQYAQGDLFVFIDDDIIVDKNWLCEIYAGSKRWSKHCIFTGKINPHWPNGKKPSFDLDKDFYAPAYGITHWIEKEEIVDFAKCFGGNLAIRRQIFSNGWRYNTEIGPKAKDYEIGGETELVKRLYDLGYRPVYLPKAIVFHQIRNEQLTMKWLFSRAFKAGRGRVDKKVKEIFNVPRCYLKEMISVSIQILLALLFFNKNKILNGCIKFNVLRGMFYQYRKKYKLN